MAVQAYVGQRLRASFLQDMIDDHLRVAKVADTPRISTAVLAADPHLTLQLKASFTYIIRGVMYSNSAAAADVQFGFSFPSGATTPFGAVRMVDSSAGVTGDVDVGAFSTATSGTSAINAAGSGGVQTTLLEATIIVDTTAGALTLMWAQKSSTASNTTLYTGSWLSAERIRTT